MTTPSNEQSLEGLRERVKAATGPDRELDAMIAATLEPHRFDAPGFTPIRPIPAFRYDGGENAIRFEGGGIMDVRFLPPVTGSTDEALALAERKLLGIWYVLAKGRMTSAEPLYGCEFLFGHDTQIAISEGHTQQGAILAALLTAMQDQNNER